jgi:ketosteroid isomerase-like protein
VRIIDAVARGDLEELPALSDPAVEWQSFFALHGSAYHGHDEAAAGWVFKFRDGRATLLRAFSDPVRALENVGRDASGLV